MVRQRIKRTISFILMLSIVLTLIPTLPTITYADTVGGVGTEGVSGGGTKDGTYTSSKSGYRMYIINTEGQRVTNIVDILMNAPPSSGCKYTYNTRFENIRYSYESGDYKLKMNSDLIGLTSSLETPIGYNGEFYPKGDDFREWMLAGEEMPVSHYHGGNINYNYTSGGKSSGNSSGGSSSKETETMTLAEAVENLNYQAWATLNNLHLVGENWTRAQAISKADTAAYSLYWRYTHEAGMDGGALSNALRSIHYDLEANAPKLGWKDSVTSEGTGGRTGSELREDGVIEAPFINNIFDIAHASETSGTHEVSGDDIDTSKMNIYPLLNSNNLFEFKDSSIEKQYYDHDNDPSTEKQFSMTDTMAAYQLQLIVEPVYWFRPAQIEGPVDEDLDGDGKLDDYVIGDACSLYFYGTVVSYGQWYQECKASGSWTDGGRGGWYSNALNTTSAQALLIDNPLTKEPGNTEAEVIIPAFKGGTANTKTGRFTNNELADERMNQGYAMHYYYITGNPAKLPKIPTYDTTEKEPNPDPHPAQDADTPEHGGTIQLADGEPDVPGTSFITVKDEVLGEGEYEEGYKNTTRTITIVKTYTKEVLCEASDPECLGTNEFGQPYKWEHISTHVTANAPGTIDIIHEPNYKVVEWFTTEYTINYSWGWAVDGGKNGPDQDKIFSKYVWFEKVEDTPWVTPKSGGSTIGVESRVPESDRTFSEEYEWSAVGEQEAGTIAKTIKMGLAADPDYDAEAAKESGEQPAEGYHDTTLYVHLLLKPGVPETHTLDDPTPDNPDNDDPKSPGPAPDPLAPYEDPDMPPEEQEQLVHNIVKVYETEMPDLTIQTDSIQTRETTAGIIQIEDEAHLPQKYALIEWKHGEPLTSGGDWDEITGNMTQVDGAGVTPDKVDIRDPSDIMKPKTLYVRLRKVYTEPPKYPGDIIIQQSQISKAVHTNDSNIGGRWGNYSFIPALVAVSPTGHTVFCSGCTCNCGDEYCPGNCYCPGYWCGYYMGTDTSVTFVFDRIGAQDELEIDEGVHTNTDPKVYKKPVHQFDVLSLSSYQWPFSSDGNEEYGEEYVTVLWRGDELKDVPTLAKYKQTDITNVYGASNYEIPQAVLASGGSQPSNKSNKKRSTDGGTFNLSFTFGLDEGASDLYAEACCSRVHIPHFETIPRNVYPAGGTQWTYEFTAKVGIQFYAGMSKALAAQPFGGVASNRFKTVSTGNHFSNNLIQGIQQIKFFPYIKMTYMTNSLKLAELEEQNVDTYKAASRYETYVLSEYESSILPSDSVEVGWQNNEEEESILLTSQQWSLHQRAINGGEAWNGTNQVLPGGAIYQLSTPNDRISNVKIITYQTVVDDKTRQYLSVPLTGDEYTVEKVASDHEDFVNDAKEVIDNLRIVQWVSKDYDSTYAWPSNWTETNGDGKVCIRGGGESLTELGLTLETNTEDKYYMKAAGAPTDYQSAKLKDITYTVADGSKEKANEGDLDIMKISQVTTVFKVFTDTAGNVYLASMKQTGTDNVEAQIKSMVNAMKDLNADTRSKYSGSVTIQRLCDRRTSGGAINAILTGDAKQIDDRTSFITNAVLCLNRNQGYDKTAAWATTDGKWYNEAFDGMYLVRQAVTIETGLQYSTSRASALDPALCPSNVGQSDLYTNAFLSQFCLNDRSDAKIAEGKDERYLGTWREGTDQEMDILLPDMEGMYQSRKFYIPNANVQDLN